MNAPAPANSRSGSSRVASLGPAPSARRFLIVVWCLAPLFPLFWSAISLAWFGLTPGADAARTPGLPPGLAFTGLLQGDQPVYTAFARGVFSRGNGLVYANPFDSDADAPRVLFNLGYVLLGWLMHPFERAWVAWEIWRMVWGTLLVGLWGVLVARVVERPSLRSRTWVAGLCGGGLAWLAWLADPAAPIDPTLIKPSPYAAEFLARFAQVEGSYGWWCLNLFRQGIYPLELFYHTLLLGVLLAWLARRWRVMLALVAVLAASHVITALLAGSVLGCLLLAEIRRGGGRGPRMALLGLALIALPFAIYYGFWLPSHPSIAAWIDQTLRLREHLPLADWPLAYGAVGGLAVGALGLASVAVAGGFAPSAAAWPAQLRTGPSRTLALWRTRLAVALARGLADRPTQLLLALAGCSVLWMNNHLFLPRPLQPLHFGRAYLFLALLLLAARGLGAIAGELPGLVRRWGRLALWLALPLLALDNAVFVARVLCIAPPIGLALLHPAQRELLDFLRSGALPSAASLPVFHSNDQYVGRLIVMEDLGRVYASEPFLTPAFGTRMETITSALRNRDETTLERLGIEYLIFMKSNPNMIPIWVRQPSQFETVYENEAYLLGRLRPQP